MWMQLGPGLDSGKCGTRPAVALRCSPKDEPALAGTCHVSDSSIWEDTDTPRQRLTISVFRPFVLHSESRVRRNLLRGIPRPITRSEKPDGGPIRYRVLHTAALWKTESDRS